MHVGGNVFSPRCSARRLVDVIRTLRDGIVVGGPNTPVLRCCVDISGQRFVRAHHVQFNGGGHFLVVVGDFFFACRSCDGFLFAARGFVGAHAAVEKSLAGGALWVLF